jgi:regulator of protease activity HflC (stomatin/prohibitin superfamily)
MVEPDIDVPEFTPSQRTTQHPARAVSGVLGLVMAALLLLGALLVFALGNGTAAAAVGLPLVAIAVAVMAAIVVVQPNDSRVLTVFGRYTGTISSPGIWLVNPLTVLGRYQVTLRVRNFQTERTKVNDALGSPIEIAAVVVWRVTDTARAIFDVDDYEEFVVTQSETALRHLAQQFPYDVEDDGPSLRGNADDVADALRVELQERLRAAGIEVMETRLAHLAYAAEIAEAMLRRQQATAIVAARRTIVDGAVGLVEMALQRLDTEGIIDLDSPARATMAANLMVVLSGDRGAQPVVNVGSR